MKRYVVKNGEMFWAKERLPYHWTPVLKDARVYRSHGGAKQVINQLQEASITTMGLAWGMQIIPVCVDRLWRVRRLPAGTVK